jgi:hypothetical protein
MVTTEYVIHQDSEPFSDRARVSAFFARADVMVQMQAHGISSEEALSRVDNLTDSEIASLAGKMDDIPAGAGSNGNFYTLDGSLVSFIGIAIYAIIAAIVLYFGFTDEKEEKPLNTDDVSLDKKNEVDISE